MDTRTKQDSSEVSAVNERSEWVKKDTKQNPKMRAKKWVKKDTKQNPKIRAEKRGTIPFSKLPLDIYSS